MKKVILTFCLLIFFACDKDEASINNNLPPNPPSLITPSNNSTVITQISDEQIYFEWNNATDPDNDITGYRIWIDSDPNFSDPFHHGTDVNNTTSYLQTNQTYYWRVTTRDSNGNVSNYSQIWSFHLEYGLAPSQPNLVFPLNETECSNDNLTFDWDASDNPLGNTVEYSLIISTSPSFDNNVDTYTTTDTEYNVNLNSGTAYYWRIEADNGTSSSISEGRSLYTQRDGTTNTIPQIAYTSPDDEAVITGSFINLGWTASDNETSNSNLSYKVYFSEVGQNLQLINEDDGLDIYLINNLNPNTTYQWSIWVTDEQGATNVGEVYTFTVN